MLNACPRPFVHKLYVLHQLIDTGRRRHAIYAEAVRETPRGLFLPKAAEWLEPVHILAVRLW